MSITRIADEIALNLDAVASIKFSETDQGLAATVNFLSTGVGGNFISEIFSGNAARNLYEVVGGGGVGEESAPTLGEEFLRSKSWYFVRGADGRRYFVAF